MSTPNAHRARLHRILAMASTDTPPPLGEILDAVASELVRLHLDRHARRLAASTEPRGPGHPDTGVTAVATLLRAGRVRVRRARDKTPFTWLEQGPMDPVSNS